ncbi:glucan endo-1,3-beta-glucosidase 12-like [Typha angustifolia]|uniref:glucan endo-1,3-beta-glucosidase 12-like n=1 Tax=Typha angustifolia TaxID=59011 RepID=UPI003C30B097
MWVMKFFYLYLLIGSLVPLLGLTNAGQGFSFHSPQDARNSLPIAVSVTEADLPLVSYSVLGAESWLKTHVLAYHPAIRITTILVGKGVLCNRDNAHQWRLVLPSVRNLYYSLVRWGLVEDIKVSPSFSADCLHYPYFRFRSDLIQDIMEPLLRFLQENSLAYSVDPLPSFLHSYDAIEQTLHSHRAALDKLGYSKIKDIRLVRVARPKSRKLSSLPFPSFLEPFTAKIQRPTPIQFAPVPDASFSFVPNASPSEIPTNPPESSVYPSPSPLSKFSPSIPPAISPIVFLSPPRAPKMPPLEGPANPPIDFATPHRSPCPAPAPVPGTGIEVGPKRHLWCVAKPTVPADKLQEAMDYACGEGGADCEEIGPNGSCFYPDTVLVHASYAFNNYWQMAKHRGGTCSFDGTAMLVTSDPSFRHCQFVLN